MDKSEQSFVELYKAGLWGTEVRDDQFQNAEIDWERVAELGRQQTVTGLIGDAMSQLSKGIVPRPTYLRLLNDVKTIEDNNLQMNTLMPILFRTLDQLNVKTWLLKGQGVAQCYENPLRRTSGDIDVFFPKLEDYEVAHADFLKHLKPENVYSDNDETKTLEFDYKGIYIELHGHIVSEVNRRCNRNFHVLLEKYQDALSRQWNGATLPPVQFDPIFIFMHTVRHYFGGGIGLRQVSDWMRYVHVHHDEIDAKKLKADLQAIGLFRLWQAFGCMAVEFLGCPGGSMYFYDGKYSKYGKRLLQYILESGNFGRYDERTKSSSHFYLVQRFVAFWGHLQMKFRNFTMFPEESVYGIPSFIKDGLRRS